MSDKQYWKLIDSEPNSHTYTYEHVMPHGVLIRTSTARLNCCAEAIVFVPNPPSTEPYR